MVSAQPQLAHYIPKDNLTSVELNKKLDEISGLALSPEGKLFAHGDEEGKIFQLDKTSGRIIKEFEIGKKDVEEDFEDLAIVGNRFYLVSSKGDIYEFKEGMNDDEVPFTKYETELKSKYDVEGLCYEPQTETLLLACKEFAGKEFEDKKTIYSFDLKTKKVNKEPRFVISLKQLEKEWDIDQFKPSGLIRHPFSGTFIILGGEGRVIIEISAEGEILNKMELDEDFHNQPEGITILNDGTMIMADEGGKGKATLIYYPYN